MDSIWGTIELPPHRQDRLYEILGVVKGACCVSIKKWCIPLSELHSMMVAIPGAYNFFSHLQTALVSNNSNCIYVK